MLSPRTSKSAPTGWWVKVLDFGLAKALGPPEGGHYVQDGRSVRLQPDLTDAPTITTPARMTGVGVILGTAAYMSPEQARGKDVDKRADIWAFGCVLYEMLTGRRAFDGEDVTETLAFLVTKEPDWSALPPATPTAVRALLKGCLEKKSRERVEDISTALFVLKDPTTLGDGPAEAGHYVRSARRRVALVGAAAVLAGAVVATTLTWVIMRPAEPVPPRVSRLLIASSGTAALTIRGDRPAVGGGD
ncbi:MAG: hypothetical protein EXQ53_11490, partial [Acidobacteria bacterium]|nr:hypothetical protein [Acidobacteriota bacterium]